jgi:hypothetical protein
MTEFVTVKDPDAVLDYSINWSTWLGDDTIAASTWTADNDGLTVVSSSNTTTATTVWLSGGVGGIYNLRNRIVTAGGRTDDRTIQIVVEQR